MVVSGAPGRAGAGRRAGRGVGGGRGASRRSRRSRRLMRRLRGVRGVRERPRRGDRGAGARGATPGAAMADRALSRGAVRRGFTAKYPANPARTRPTPPRGTSTATIAA